MGDFTKKANKNIKGKLIIDGKKIGVNILFHSSEVIAIKRGREARMV